MLRITLFYFEGETPHFLAYLDAKRASLVLVEDEAGALLIDLGLTCGGTHHPFGPGDELAEQHEGADDDPQGFEEGSDYCFHGDDLLPLMDGLKAVGSPWSSARSALNCQAWLRA